MSLLKRFRNAQSIPAKQQITAFIGDRVAFRDQGYLVSYIKIDTDGVRYNLSGRFSDMDIHDIPASEISIIKPSKASKYDGQPLLWPGDQVVVTGTDEEDVVKYVIARRGNPYWNYFVGKQAFTDKDYPAKIKKVERGQMNMFEGPSL